MLCIPRLWLGACLLSHCPPAGYVAQTVISVAFSLVSTTVKWEGRKMARYPLSSFLKLMLWQWLHFSVIPSRKIHCGLRLHQMIAFPRVCCCFCCPVAPLCPALCDPMNCSTLGFPDLHHLPEFVQTHVHWVGDAIQPSRPLSSPSPFALSLSQHQGLFQWVGSSHQVAEVLELHHQSFQWIFRVDFL